MNVFRSFLRISVFLLVLTPTLAFAQLSSDLAITKTDTPDPVITGNNVTYTITITNNGPGTVITPTVVDTFPAGTTQVSSNFSPAQTGLACVGSPGSVACTIDNMAQGAVVTWTLVLNTTGILPGTILTNTASVTALSNVDPVPGNNTATATTLVGAAISAPTLSEWALLLLAGALGLVAFFRVR